MVGIGDIGNITNVTAQHFAELTIPFYSGLKLAITFPE